MHQPAVRERGRDLPLPAKGSRSMSGAIANRADGEVSLRVKDEMPVVSGGSAACIGATVDVVQRIAETVNGTSVTSAAVQNATANPPGQDNDQADA